ncbi:uncharacterized protein V1516DRAFT_608785, partial [Lipomyces oligophaga]|uniref:uncharacterized protein n=1 Tax=Lipomyces oligophaga TaxID=45792 RepID=UPI0034CE1D81
DPDVTRISTKNLRDLSLSSTDEGIREKEDQEEDEEEANDPDLSVEAVLRDAAISTQEKSMILQRSLITASSIGDYARVRRIVQYPDANKFVDLNLPDDYGTTLLIHAVCFGDIDTIRSLIDAGADVNQNDKMKWTPLMWAAKNGFSDIVTLLLAYGAIRDTRTTAGLTAYDLSDDNLEIKEMLSVVPMQMSEGANEEEDFVVSASDDSRDMDITDRVRPVSSIFSKNNRQLVADSAAADLEVDLSRLSISQESTQIQDPDSINEADERVHFDWDNCLPDQMFVFSYEDIPKILDAAIGRLQPIRTPAQKPVPANVLFLSARFAHYYGTPELMHDLLYPALERISGIVESHEDDMTFLAFWLSNLTLLLYYFRRDPGLLEATTEYQQELSELVTEVFVLAIRDAERRLDRVLDSAVLDHEIIPGLQEVQFQREWPFFRGSTNSNRASDLQNNLSESESSRGLGTQSMNLADFRRPSPNRLAKPSPRNVTSLLSSTLFVLELYDVHPVIITQVISQVFYWLDATLFNRIIASRKYLARTYAMQIRLNVSQLEDWARQNDKRPEDLGRRNSGSGTGVLHESTYDLAKRHLEPLVELLQWLQCLSSLGDNIDAISSTIERFPLLSADQLMEVGKKYRAEVGEERISKSAVKYLHRLAQQQKEPAFGGTLRRSTLLTQILPASVGPERERRRSSAKSDSKIHDGNEGEFREVSISDDKLKENGQTGTNLDNNNIGLESTKYLANDYHQPQMEDRYNDDERELALRCTDGIYIDISLILPFVIPTTTEMNFSWGDDASKQRRHSHTPVLPNEFLQQLDATSSLNTRQSSVKSGRT